MAERIFFKSPDHKQRFLAAMQELGKIYDGKLDQEYGAALYILSAELFIWNEASGYANRYGIDFPTILKEVDLSSGYSVLVKLAGNLFNGHTHIEPIDFMRLDESNFTVAMTALQIRRTRLPIDDFKPESEAQHE